jgi:hypothetical protein
METFEASSHDRVLINVFFAHNLSSAVLTAVCPVAANIVLGKAEQHCTLIVNNIS